MAENINNDENGNCINRVLPTVFDYPYMANRFIQSIIDTGWNLTSEEQNKLSKYPSFKYTKYSNKYGCNY